MKLCLLVFLLVPVAAKRITETEKLIQPEPDPSATQQDVAGASSGENSLVHTSSSANPPPKGKANPPPKGKSATKKKKLGHGETCKANLVYGSQCDTTGGVRCVTIRCEGGKCRGVCLKKPGSVKLGWPCRHGFECYNAYGKPQSSAPYICVKPGGDVVKSAAKTDAEGGMCKENPEFKKQKELAKTPIPWGDKCEKGLSDGISVGEGIEVVGAVAGAIAASGSLAEQETGRACIKGTKCLNVGGCTKMHGCKFQCLKEKLKKGKPCKTGRECEGNTMKRIKANYDKYELSIGPKKLNCISGKCQFKAASSFQQGSSSPTPSPVTMLLESGQEHQGQPQDQHASSEQGWYEEEAFQESARSAGMHAPRAPKVDWDEAAETSAIAGLLAWKMTHSNYCPDSWPLAGSGFTYGVGCGHPQVGCSCPKWFMEQCVDNTFPIEKFGRCRIAIWFWIGIVLIPLCCIGGFVAICMKSKKPEGPDAGSQPHGAPYPPASSQAYYDQQGAPQQYGQQGQAW